MAPWEYDIRSVRYGEWDSTKEDLNKLGIDGWELIRFSEDIDESGMIKAFFKRPLDCLEI
ncbi:hypothetical protein RE476_05020 [Methanolobus mangrovi]|uniref:DUF4177 domain-containing protein n=1 Tax=Methanolobus mangrovi TaxID=3072977 RepID=A0AA51YK10_9EURY|nr:hypothetical protein [Methanolobus mangrovi]WMW23195.1 hypothetical protein RE476_05020 [Methanolobus mangrovi]